MSKVVKPVLGAVVIAALLTGGWFFFRPSAAHVEHDENRDARGQSPSVGGNKLRVHPAAQKRLGIATGAATMREIVKPIDVPGMVQFDDRKVAHLKPRTKGRVLTLAVRPGDVVVAGAVLATLDASGVLDARNGLESARATLGEAKATRDAALIAVTRAGDLLKIGGVAKAELERRQVEAAKAEAALQSAQAQVDLYSAQYERLAPARGGAPGTSEIVAPFEGVVVSANLTLGEVVDTSQDVFTVADPSTMLIIASVFGFDIGAVQVGDKAIVRAPVGPQAGFDAHVVSVNAALDPQTNAASARLRVDNPREALKANMFVSVSIEADLGRRAVTIPASAVQETEQGPIAFVRTASDTFEKRDLTLGLQRSDWVEIVKGVEDGEIVATDGSFGLKAILLRNLLGATD